MTEVVASGELTTCARKGCVSTFLIAPAHPNKVFCSRACASRANNVRYGSTSQATDAARASGGRPIRVCAVCGGSFIDERDTVAGRYPLTCSEPCYNLRRRARVHGTTVGHLIALQAAQDNKCALCHISFDDAAPEIDHDHTNYEIRGLLCKGCNVMLGWFESRRRRVLEYLGEVS